MIRKFLVFLFLLFSIQASAGATSAPYMQTVSPSSGPSGSVVTVTGSGFTGTNSAGIGGSLTGVSFRVVSDSEIMLTIPKGASTGQLNITNPLGTSFDPRNFVVTSGTGSGPTPTPTPPKATPTPTPKSSPTPSPTPVTGGGSGGCTGNAKVYAYSSTGEEPGWGDFDNGASTNYEDTSGAPLSGNKYDAKTTISKPYGEWLYHSPCYNSTCESGKGTPQFGVNITGCKYMYISLKAGAVTPNWQIYAVLDYPADSPTGVAAFSISSVSVASQGGGWIQYQVPLYPSKAGAPYLFTGPSQTQLPSGANSFYKFGLQDTSGKSSNDWFADEIYFSAE